MISTTLAIGGLLAAAAVVAVVLWVRGRGADRRPPGRLVIIMGPRQGEQIELEPGRTRIGALEDNDIVIPSKQVSRYHAEVRVRGGRVYIWDLKARNKTYVNGDSVNNCELNDGDVITIGDAELRYER